MTGRLRIGLSAAILAALAGCSFDTMTYTIGRYGNVIGVNVTLRCRDTYEVLDRPEAMTMLVATNPLSEIMVACLDGGPDTVTRQREVARIFLKEKSGRPLCQISGERNVTLTHREFYYRCPDDPKSSPRLQRARQG